MRLLRRLSRWIRSPICALKRTRGRKLAQTNSGADSVASVILTHAARTPGEHSISVPPVKRHPYDQWSPDARALDLVGDKWTLLIVRDLMSGPRRFVELQRVLPGISTEQLRSRLNRMVADGMLTRKRYREVPPRVDYELTARARELAPVLAELARWGWEWAWGPPRPTERVDVGAVFRLIPGLATGDVGATGTVLLTITDVSPGAHRVTLAPGRGEIAEGDHGHSDAHVSGTAAAWVAALAPMADRDGLAISGNRRLAVAVLDLLAAGGERAAAAAPLESAAG
ncbi:MAG: winged helix-turn-helix transcriptional regulator [Solirubrobacteraceae bacterium]